MEKLKEYYDSIECEMPIGEHVLFWYEDGYGYLPPNPQADVYDEDYFANYQQLAQTEMGLNLNEARINFCRQNPLAEENQDIVDVGVGGGAFVDRFAKKGYDVNPSAVDWLIENNLFTDIYDIRNSINWMSFWDVLEHITDIQEVLKIPNKGIYLSMPIYEGFADCINSKHFKPDEHVWYFTHDGLVKMMLDNGYILLYHNDIETKLGRESIGSYCFVRESFYNEMFQDDETT